MEGNETWLRRTAVGVAIKQRGARFLALKKGDIVPRFEGKRSLSSHCRYGHKNERKPKIHADEMLWKNAKISSN